MARATLRLSAPETGRKDQNRTLWKANLRIQNEKQDFLFRSTEDFAEASALAQKLCESSPSCAMVGAVIVGIERMAKLWN
jgi:hypothetical protein